MLTIERLEMPSLLDWCLAEAEVVEGWFVEVVLKIFFKIYMIWMIWMISKDMNDMNDMNDMIDDTFLLHDDYNHIWVNMIMWQTQRHHPTMVATGSPGRPSPKWPYRNFAKLQRGLMKDDWLELSSGLKTWPVCGNYLKQIGLGFDLCLRMVSCMIVWLTVWFVMPFPQKKSYVCIYYIYIFILHTYIYIYTYFKTWI